MSPWRTKGFAASVRGMRLGTLTEKHLAIVLADVLGEEERVAKDIAAWFPEYLARVPFLSALGLRIAVLALIWLPLLWVGRPLPASRLAPDLRARYLSRWPGSSIYLVRESFFLVKAVALMGWGAHPTVRARLGLPPLVAGDPLG